MSRPIQRRQAPKRKLLREVKHLPPIYTYTFTPKGGGDPIEFKAPGNAAAEAYVVKKNLGHGSLSGGPDGGHAPKAPKPKAPKKRAKKKD